MDRTDEARNHFIQGLSRISSFWGFPRGMGTIYGVIYLSQEPIGLDDIVSQSGISKGAVSTNARNLERLGMIHKHVKLGDRKDYYTAETDFWKIVKSILKEREKPEFSKALATVSESLDMVNAIKNGTSIDTLQFYQERFSAMKSFFDSLDKIVSIVLTLESIKNDTMQSVIKSLVSRK